MAQNGITGNNPVILDDEYIKYIETFGSKWYLFDLYIKFYSCCRWAHSPIGAVASLMRQYSQIGVENIKKVDVYSFGNAGTLYRCPPKTEDEAQYNIIYPIAAQIVFGNCGPLESSTSKMLDSRIPSIMEKIEFHHEPEYDKVFPAKRLSRVEITLNNGEKICSEAFEPKGDKNEEVSIEDLIKKTYEINGLYVDIKYIDEFIDVIMNSNMNEPFSVVFDKIRNMAVTNIHPEIEFI